MKIRWEGLVQTEFYFPLDEDDEGRFAPELTLCMGGVGKNDKGG